MSSLPIRSQPAQESSVLKRKLFDDKIETSVADKRQNTGSTSDLVIVDPDGDLRMVFETGVLQVSRKALSLASPVFLAMFKKDSGFMEAVNQSSDQHGIQTTSFPDDSLDMMIVITHIIHLQFDKVPSTLSFGQLHQMAIYCDRYDLKRCLGPYPDIWSKSHLETYALEGHKEWLLISSLFNHGWIFKEITKYLILNTKIGTDGRLVISESEEINEYVSESLIERITSSRTAVMFLVQDLYWQEKKRLLASEKLRVCKVGGPHVAKCDAINLGLLLQKLPDLSDPRQEISWRTVKDMIAIPGFIEDVCGALIFRFGDHRPCIVGKKLAAEAKKVLEGVHGLDLE